MAQIPMNCACGKPIGQERIDIFLELRGKPPTTCTSCSKEKANIGFMVPAGPKGTALELVIVDGSKREDIRRATMDHLRTR